MPGFNGTGPAGMGPLTGRGMGYCAVPLPHMGVGITPYRYAGIYGAAMPMTNPYRPIIPYRRSWFGIRFGFGWFGSGRGCGRGRGRGRWFW
jgi:hypothetical protein